ncbi:diguanylate cyclase [Actinomyces sp. zg328]|uniref:diguanylate cyclase n=1 Tax=Actinomyces sp. zg328 TaxID=2609287 RepID=UPI00135B6CD8|nr:diguanylate cyclase [Actinomyces sp. zg328]
MESQIGYERFFDPEDIFFSTTGPKGVIRRTNRTFDSLSRYSRDRLQRAPHNIVRHLDMPAGLFKLMWDDLGAGRPVSAYVLNRAADGVDYRVFATIVPIRDGFLSVRTKPLREGAQRAIEEAYRRVRAREREFAGRGASRSQIGEMGAAELAAELAGLGYPALIDATRALLPAEVSALVSQGVRVPDSTGVSGPVADILRAAADLERSTNRLVFQLEEYLRLLGSLEATRDSMLRVAERVEFTGRVLGAQARTSWQRTRSDEIAERVVELAGQAAPALRALPRRMSAARDGVLDLRFSVALMRLMTLMVGRFSRSILDGSEEDPIGSISDLCEALHSVVGAMDAVCARARQAAETLDADLRAVTPQIDRITRRTRQWVDDKAATRAVTPADTIDQDMLEVRSFAQQGAPEVRPMAALAAECRTIDLPFDSAAAHQLIGSIITALGQLS